MKKLFTILVVLFAIINLGLSVIAGFSFGEDPDVEKLDSVKKEPRKTADKQTPPSTYAAGNVFYLISTTEDTQTLSLKGVPFISDGSDPKLNKKWLTNGAPTPFSYPAPHRKPVSLKYNESFPDNPFISLVVNSMLENDKTIVVTLGIDTNGNYDPHDPTSLEHRCEFPTYRTTGDFSDGTLEEEVYEAEGTWQGGLPKKNIDAGRIILEITQTSPNGDDALLYCGFNWKLSWISCPYSHTDLVPRAKINQTYLNQGFDPDNPIMVGDRVTFDGSDSFDPNDDLDGNERIEGNEIDRLMYKWTWGDGTSTGWANDNRRMYHIYKSDDIPLTWKFKDFNVNLTVQDPQGNIDWNSTKVRIHRGNHSPEIKSLKVNGIEQIAPSPLRVISPLDPTIRVWFSAYAIDKDGDELYYYWDFNGDLIPDVEGIAAIAATVSYVFSPIIFSEGEYKITLTVSDKTLVEDAKAICFVKLQNNILPVATLKAQRENDNKFYSNSIWINANEEIIFYANESFDPDNLPGFDVNYDNKTDYQLMYRFNFNRYDPSATTGWTTQDYVTHEYVSSGIYKYEVTLEVDDGTNITVSPVFTVNINVRPVAQIIVDPQSYDKTGNLMVNKPIIFNGSGSYDPNGDDIQNYTWTVGVGINSFLMYDSKITHSFKLSGVHTVALKVFDGSFWSPSISYKVVLPEPNKKPIPRYSISPLEVNTSETVYFDGSETTDQDSEMIDLRFYWDFGDNTTYASGKGENSTSHKYRQPGDYRVELTVQDDTGLNASIDYLIVKVKNRPPKAVIKKLDPVEVDDTVYISAEGSSDPEGGPLLYIWNFGDESEELRTNKTDVEHAWSTSSVYQLELTVQDERGATHSTFIRLVVNEKESGGGGFLGMSQEETNTVIAGAVITIIIVIVIIVVVVVLIRTREKI